MASTIAELMVSIGGDISDLEKSLSKAQRKMERTGKSLQKAGRTMTMSISLPLAAAGAAAVKTAGDFEDSFADIRKTVDATEPVFEQMSKDIRELSKEVPTSVEELNRLGGVAGQLGVEADNIVDFTKTIAMLGDATDIAGEQAALSLSRFMNVMGTAEGDIDRLGATIVGLGNNFAAMESEIVDIATSMAPLGNSIGLTEQNVLALSTAIAASGGEARAASTAFQKTANTMQRAVLEGTEDLKVFARTAGVSTEQFRKAFEEDSFQALIMFMEGLRQTQQEGESMAAVLDEIGLADQRLIREFGKVTGNLDQVRQAAGMANEEWDRNTALTEEAQKRYKTFNSQMRIFWNTVKDLGITIGNDLIPFVTKLTDLAKDAITIFDNLNPAVRGIGIALGGILTISGPIIWFMGSMITHTGTLIGAIPKLTKTIYGLTTALKASVGVLTGYVGVITALGIASYKANQRSQERISAIDEEIAAINSSSEANQALIKTEEKIAQVQSQMAKGARGLGKRLEDLRQRRDALIEQRDMMAGQELGGMSMDTGNALSGLIKLQDFINTDLTGAFKNASNESRNTESEVSNISVGTADMGGMKGVEEQTVNSLANMKAAQSEYASVSEAAGIKSMSVWERFSHSFNMAMSNVQLTSEAVTTAYQSMADEGISSLNDLASTVVNTARKIISAEIAKGIASAVSSALSSLPPPFNIAAAASAGAAAAGLFNSLVPKLAQGGLAFGPTLAMVGDNRNAQSDPEVIAPLSKLEGMGGSRKVEVVGNLRGDTIYLANARGQNKFR